MLKCLNNYLQITMQTKLKILISELNQDLVEREEITKIALLTILAGENIILVGPPGTGKSLIARRIAECFEAESDKIDYKNTRYFEYLLTKFSTPEEIFGPLSISELKQDKFRRNTAGYLPTVKIAFLDEIFKANSSILNALLTILNERIFHNGTEKVEVPLQGLIAASNELPANQEELSALYDRFLVRSFVGYVSESRLADLLKAETATQACSFKLSAAELAEIKAQAKSITLPEKMMDAILKIREEHRKVFKEDNRESISDRRLKKALGLLKVSATTNKRTEIDLSDLFLLRHLLWNHPDNKDKVGELVINVLKTFSYQVPVNEANAEVVTITKTVSSSEKAKFHSLIPGLQGGGTAHDPLLIQNIEDLIDLARPDVGQQGYYFRQTADIDLSEIADQAWPDMSFQGHFDGNGYTIKRASNAVLFKSIKESSSIRNLKLENMWLADMAMKCSIICCSASSVLLNNAEDCTITACISGSSLIFNSATQCVISDCQVSGDWNTLRKQGGIATSLNNGSIVERCFVAGQLSYHGGGYYNFSGITVYCRGSTIRCCAIGPVNTQISDNPFFRLAESIDTCRLESNASIDTNQTYNVENNTHGKDGATVSAALFKQRYFEHTLGWDFEKVWQWDDANNQPILRQEGITAGYAEANTAEGGSIELLLQQIQANIWL